MIDMKEVITFIILSLGSFDVEIDKRSSCRSKRTLDNSREFFGGFDAICVEAAKYIPKYYRYVEILQKRKQFF